MEQQIKNSVTLPDGAYFDTCCNAKIVLIGLLLEALFGKMRAKITSFRNFNGFCIMDKNFKLRLLLT